MKTQEQQIQEFEEAFGELKAMLHLPDEIIIRLNNKFFESVSLTLAQLNEAIIILDYKAIEMLAHTIKGSAGSLRYASIGEIAHKIEKNAHTSEHFTYRDTLEELKKEVHTAQDGYALWTRARLGE